MKTYYYRTYLLLLGTTPDGKEADIGILEIMEITKNIMKQNLQTNKRLKL